MPSRIYPLVSLVAVLAGSCTPFDDLGHDTRGVEFSRQPLLGGTIATAEDDPAVVALANSFGPFCTGTLVTPQAVLTAAHCIDQFDPSSPTVGVLFGPDIDNGARLGAIGGEVRPGWDGVVGPDKPNDVGILLLKRPVDPALPIPMNTRPPIEGESYRHVGYGVFDNSMPSDGRKRFGTVTISSVGSGIISSGTAEISICFGDSGGPGFVENDGVEHIAGIHSFTSTAGGGCRAPAGDARVDVALDWIQPWLDDNDPSCGPDRVCATGCSADPDCALCGADGVCAVCADPDPDCPSKATGEPCQQDDECEGELCVVWDGDSASQFCSLACGSDGDCPSDMKCRMFTDGNLCYYDGKPPGRLGSSCDTDTECFSNQCNANECVERCNLAIGLNCPDEFTCTGDDAGEFHCRADAPTDSGGCRAAGSGATCTWLIALLYLAFRRRDPQPSS